MTCSLCFGVRSRFVCGLREPSRPTRFALRATGISNKKANQSFQNFKRHQRYHGHSMSDPGSTYRTRDEISAMRQVRPRIRCDLIGGFVLRAWGPAGGHGGWPARRAIAPSAKHSHSTPSTAPLPNTLHHQQQHHHHHHHQHQHTINTDTPSTPIHQHHQNRSATPSSASRSCSWRAASTPPTSRRSRRRRRRRSTRPWRSQR